MSPLTTAVALFVASGMALQQEQSRTTASIGSPDGRIRIELSLLPVGAERDVPHYRVMFGKSEVVGYSRLGIELEGGSTLGGPCEILETDLKFVKENFTQVTGKRREVNSHAGEAIVLLREKKEPHRVWRVVMRAYDDGAAFRYRFPKQKDWETLAIAGERTEFKIPAETKAFALPLNGFTTSYEKRYVASPVKDLPKQWLLGLPLLLELPTATWAAITEANIDEYAGLYLAPAGDGLLSGRLSPLPREPGLGVRAPLPHASPWRVVMVGDRVGKLVESDIVLKLSDPCAIEDTSWIKSGKTTFPWWNAFHEEKVDFKPGLNTATAKHYIDFCAEAGIPYHSLDGTNDQAWYGGPIGYQGADITKAVEGLDMPEVLSYAKARGVRIRLWMHWLGAAKHMERAFPLYREWGIEGVMLDFMDRDDQEMNRFLRKAVKLAAENHLTITLHGCPKPTGLERTYPNLLTHEGVMNLEYDKWDKAGITPDHEVTVPFTRMLAGPLDFHQGSFRTVAPAAFSPRNEAPLVIGTRARTLASYVIYQNHLSMVADYPSAYRGHPGTPVLAAIPTTWDDTKVLDARVGEFAVIGRRSGTNWHLGAMTDGTARELKVVLDFLPKSERFAAEIWYDDSAAKHRLARKEMIVESTDVLTLRLDAAGGGYVTLRPVKD